jgi:hypothetical protein
MSFKGCGAGFRALCWSPSSAVLRLVVVSLLCLQAPGVLAGSLEKRKSEVNAALSAKAWDKAFSLCHEVLSRGETSKVLWLAAGKAAFHLGFPKAAGQILDRGEVETAEASTLRNRLIEGTTPLTIRCENCPDDELIRRRFSEFVQPLVKLGEVVDEQTVLKRSRLSLSPMQASVLAAQIFQLTGKAQASKSEQVKPSFEVGGALGWTLRVRDVDVPAQGLPINGSITLIDRGFVDLVLRERLKRHRTNTIQVRLLRLPRLDLTKLPSDEAIEVDGRRVQAGIMTVEAGDHVITRIRGSSRVDQRVTAVVDKLVIVSADVNAWAMLDFRARDSEEQLQVDDRDVSVDEMPVSPGPHRLTRIRGTQRWTIDIEARKDQPFVFESSASPWPMVRVVGASTSVTIKANEQKVELTDGVAYLPPGPVELSVWRKGSKERAFELNLTSGDTQEVVLPARLKVSLPEGTWELRLDGKVLDVAGTELDMEISPSEHELKIRSPRYEEVLHNWRSDPGAEVVWSPQSSQLNVTAPWSKYESAQSDRVLTYILLGSGGAVAAGAAGSLGVASSFNSDADAAYQSYQAGVLPSALAPYKDQVRDAESAAGISSGVGVALGVAGAGLLAWGIYRLMTQPSPVMPLIPASGASPPLLGVSQVDVNGEVSP